MSGTMVERMAKAICDSDKNGTWLWEMLNEEGRADYRATALAALRAMREPTEAMTLAGSQVKMTWDGQREFAAAVDVIELVWRAAIDAALSEAEHKD